ncbi:hypothetical protein J7T55_004571 [Diaporthe amygdali]|uniref:uncharacterized protein n=1 Tax=Phomopsis amygdali TaxID=1214568 RepID=UPI0022FE64C5|nr:uncharacterized protein J7T55_004571 [Diaporthe amygdali]KAJ0114829.1 hypothetical protein J7T55_004571 [Diaporthe amygdali]
MTISQSGIQALRRCESMEDPEFQDIIRSTHAIVFLGTPHRGSPGLASTADVVRRIAGAVLRFDSHDSILRSLGIDAPELELSRESFVSQWRKFQFTVKTFQEAHALTGVKLGLLNDKVVPDASSSLDDPREHAETIPANHMDMCKYNGPSDPGYQKVGGELAKIVKQIKRREVNSTATASVQSLNSKSPHPVTNATYQVTGKHEDFVVAKCKQALSYPQIFDRQNAIHPPVLDTCQWLRSHRTFVSWSQRSDVQTNHGILWIKGLPGSGKSTVMKEILLFTKATAQQGHIIANFFFNARGSELDRTPQGMLRSFLLQLLEQSHPFQSVIVDHFKSETSYTDSALWGPTLEELLRLIRRCLVETTYTNRVTIFLDAVDECEAKYVRELAYFLRSLTSDAYALGRYLDICLSSRHYPHISISRCPEITLERENRNDIFKMVEYKIPYDVGFTANVIDRLRMTIMEKSSGIFLWVVLVVDEVLRDIDNGCTFWEVQKTLDSVPTDLVTMFTRLLKAMSVLERLKLRNLVHWLLLGSPSFQVNEISAFDTFGRDNFDFQAPAEAVKPYVDDRLEQERQKRLVRSISRGLVEVSAGKAQFVHESVREFFLQDGFTVFHCRDADTFLALGHCMIIRSCVRAMLFKQVSKDLDSTKEVLSQLLFTDRDAYNWLIKHTYRFLPYHVHSAQHCAQFPLEIVHRIQGVISAFPDLEESLHLQNMKLAIGLEKLLPFHAMFSHEALDRYLVDVLSRLETLCSEVMFQLYDDIVHPKVVDNALYRRLRDSSIKASSGKTELQQWKQTEEFRLVSLANELISRELSLQESNLGDYVNDTEGNTMLHFAAWLDLGHLVQVLIDAGHPIDIQNAYGMSPLHLACQSKYSYS